MNYIYKYAGHKTWWSYIIFRLFGSINNKLYFTSAKYNTLL